MISTLSRLRGLLGKNGKVDYEKAKTLASDDDPEVRRQLAERDDLKPELLYFLAEDADPTVRRVIAKNPATPAQADLLLTGDADERVRAELAGKIARVAPGLTDHQRDKVKKIAYQALSRLVEDQLPMVRQILADTLKDVAGAPPEIIKRLAHDTELSVAGPVLQFSPVLTDTDLTELIETQPAAGALSFISRRSNLTETVTEAIVGADDVSAITELLKNPSAQIREETLDRLVDRAPGIPQWHEPLVRRPKLPRTATVKLAQFVAHSLVKVLIDRQDISPEVAEEISRVMDQRIEEEGAEPIDTGAKPDKISDLGPEWERALEAAFDKAKTMHEAGELTEPEVAKALNAGADDFVIGALAVLGDLKPKEVARVIDSQSAKAVTGLAFIAGLSAPFSVQLQTKLGHIVPDQAVKPGEDGEYTMSEEELVWQLDMFTG